MICLVPGDPHSPGFSIYTPRKIVEDRKATTPINRWGRICEQGSAWRENQAAWKETKKKYDDQKGKASSHPNGKRNKIE